MRTKSAFSKYFFFAASVLGAALLTITSPARAVIGAPTDDWVNSFLFQGSGVDKPLVRVGFNPQPEPTALLQTIYAHPPDPGHPPEPGIEIINAGVRTGQLFTLVFAIADDGGALHVASVGAPRGHDLVVDILDEANALMFQVLIGLTTTSGGNPTDWVGFNPQPEPPALGTGAASFGGSFGFDAFSDAVLAVSVLDAQGNAIGFTQVSEPASLLLSLTSLGLIAGSRKKATAPTPAHASPPDER